MDKVAISPFTYNIYLWYFAVLEFPYSVSSAKLLDQSIEILMKQRSEKSESTRDKDRWRDKKNVVHICI